jgi:N-acetylglucosamine-6-phosphate deacetylase
MPEPQDEALSRFTARGALAIGGRLIEGAVVVEAGRITEIRHGAGLTGLPEPVHEAAIVAPGLIDLQVNGGFGKEVGVHADAIPHLSRMLPATGVTTFLPTLISSPAAVYPALFESFATAPDGGGARPVGLHLEGPFLSRERRGAHSLAAIENADDALFASLLASGEVTLVTIASDRAGGLERIRCLVEAGMVVSLGHTNATFEEIQAGADAGATMATHLFNAMSPFGHRVPGAIGAALVEDRLTVGLIADGVHAHPAALDLAIRAKGLDRIALVSDMVSAAGMGPGTYRLGGRAITVDRTSVRLADGTLAGSILTMDQAIRNLVTWGLLTPAAAIKLATEVPAKVINLSESGKFAIGGVADLALFDQRLAVTHTIIGGRLAYRS